MKGNNMLSSTQRYEFGSHSLRRRYERKPYDADIVFSSNGRIYRGQLKDISVGGAFIWSKHTQDLIEGEAVTISVPFTDGRRHVKRTGSVLWKNSTGFAISFY